MTDHPGWYPPGQVCSPPEVPPYLRNVYDLKPIVGVPSDAEMMGIHAVIQAANRVSGVPGMHDQNLFMRLSDHLFGAQMARYRSKYSLITFPSDATYTPPALPVHVSVNLESVCGAPSDENIVKVQEAVRAYQHFSSVPSMYDPMVNMELSQHLFDIQMARYMRVAGESQPNLQSHASTRGPVQVAITSEENIAATNNVGTGANAASVYAEPQLALGINTCELMERSNQLAERFNQLLERSNELVERCTQAMDQPSTQILAERFNQVLERLTQPSAQSQQPAERNDRLAERFNQLIERFNQLMEKSDRPARRANELAEKANQLAEKLNQSTERSNQLSEQANESSRRLEDTFENINRMLMWIQRAIVRNHKGNTTRALDCLVNEKGITPIANEETGNYSFSDFANTPTDRVPVVIGGVSQSIFVPRTWLGGFLRFYGIDDWLESASSTELEEGMEGDARERLGEYLSSCLG